MDTYADDLAALTDKLDLKNAIHVATPPAVEKWLAILVGMVQDALPWPCSSAPYRR